MPVSTRRRRDAGLPASLARPVVRSHVPPAVPRYRAAIVLNVAVRTPGTAVTRKYPALCTPTNLTEVPHRCRRAAPRRANIFFRNPRTKNKIKGMCLSLSVNTKRVEFSERSNFMAIIEDTRFSKVLFNRYYKKKM